MAGAGFGLRVSQEGLARSSETVTYEVTLQVSTFQVPP